MCYRLTWKLCLLHTIVCIFDLRCYPANANGKFLNRSRKTHCTWNIWHIFILAYTLNFRTYLWFIFNNFIQPCLLYFLALVTVRLQREHKQILQTTVQKYEESNAICKVDCLHVLAWAENCSDGEVLFCLLTVKTHHMLCMLIV